MPRPVLFGNFSLVGVCHAHVDDPVVFKRLSGFNFPAHADGEQLHAELLALFAAGKLRAIVGQQVPFRELPAALGAMEQRQTVGRTVVRLSQPEAQLVASQKAVTRPWYCVVDRMSPERMTTTR